jgi:hypothetical protein
VPTTTKIKSARKEQSGSAEQTDVSSSASANTVIGYACSCGFKTTDKKEFTTHVLFAAQRDGKGTHKSLGQIDMTTGEVVHPPWSKRSSEEKKRTKIKPTTSGGDGGRGGDTRLSQGPNSLAGAQQIRLVPRVFTIDYTPIMRSAQDAATKFFNWRADMPLENFLDTVLYLFFQEKGITLCGYIVDEAFLVKKEGDDGHRTS